MAIERKDVVSWLRSNSGDVHEVLAEAGVQSRTADVQVLDGPDGTCSILFRAQRGPMTMGDEAVRLETIYACCSAVGGVTLADPGPRQGEFTKNRCMHALWALAREAGAGSPAGGAGS